MILISSESVFKNFVKVIVSVFRDFIELNYSYFLDNFMTNSTLRNIFKRSFGKFRTIIINIFR